MSFYKTSTQATMFLLSQETLSKRRSTAYSEAQSRLQSLPPSMLLTASEEGHLRRFHERRILHFSELLKLPPKVGSTAIMYFKRFYMDKSIMEYNPAGIALVAVYVAGKAEEVVMSADEVVERMHRELGGVKEQVVEEVGSVVVLGVELEFLEAIEFCMICYHPYRSLGIVREKLKMCGLFKSEDLGKVKHRAEYILKRRCLLSDLVLLYPPGVLAVAAVILAAEEWKVGAEEIGKVLGIDCRGGGVVGKVVEECRKIEEKAGENEIEIVREMERKRREIGGGKDNFYGRIVGEVKWGVFEEEWENGETGKRKVVEEIEGGEENGSGLKRAKVEGR